jgi:RHS repeat-associated protein
VFFDDLIITHTKGKVLQEDHYYPFGLGIAALSSTAPLSKPNRYKFNGGTEFNTDFDFNTYETLFRGYDPALGRFMQIDPLADFMPGINPYQFAFDNPVLLNDPDGLKPDPKWRYFWVRKKKMGIRGRNRRYQRTGGRRPSGSRGSNKKPNTSSSSPSVQNTLQMPSISGSMDRDFTLPPFEPNLKRVPDMIRPISSINPPVFERELPKITRDELSDNIFLIRGRNLRFSNPVFTNETSNFINEADFMSKIRPLVDYLLRNSKVVATITISTTAPIGPGLVFKK